MPPIDALPTIPDIRRAAALADWMSALRLVGAALVALGVVFELVGELGGRRFDQQVEVAHAVEIERLAARVAALSEPVAGETPPRRMSVRGPAHDPGRAPGPPSCPRAARDAAL